MRHLPYAFFFFCFIQTTFGQSQHHWVILNTSLEVIDTLATSADAYLSQPEAGICVYKEGNRYGLIRTDGTVLMPAQHDSVYIADDLVYVREYVSGRKEWSLYDTMGIKKSTYYYDQMKPGDHHRIPVAIQGYWGFLNRGGEEVIHCLYDEISVWKQGGMIVKLHGRRIIIDNQGDWKGWLPEEDPMPVNLTEEEAYQVLRPESEGLYAIKKEGLYGFVDQRGRLRIANRYQAVGDFQEGLAAIQLRGKWGFINKNEQFIIQPLYRKVLPFEKGMTMALDEGGWGLLTHTGEPLTTFTYDTISPLPTGRFLISKEKRFGLLSDTGKLLINPRYDHLEDTGTGHVIIRKAGLYGLLTTEGVDILPPVYDRLYYDPVKHTYLVMKKSDTEKTSLP